jgi:hypothetical protein
MPLDFPNIVPPNNLRLPDALTIEHGPAPLLAKFIMTADQYAREAGLRLRLRHDFDELHDINKMQVSAGNWYPLIDTFNPLRSDVRPENAFWLSGENEQKEIVTTFAARIYYWPDTNLKEQAVAMMYGRDDGQPCVITADAAGLISGVVLCSGAAWVRPDYRGRQLSRLLPRIAKAYAVSRWPVDWTFGYVVPALVEKGVASSSYGTGHFSRSVWYPESSFGELVIAYTCGYEVCEDLERFLTAEASKSDRDVPFSRLAQELTKISADGVFQGRSSRS